MLVLVLHVIIWDLLRFVFVASKLLQESVSTQIMNKAGVVERYVEIRYLVAIIRAVDLVMKVCVGAVKL